MGLPTDIPETEGSRAKKLRKTLLRGAGFILGLFLIYWFVSKTDITGIWEQLKRINIRFLYQIAVTFSAYLMVTIAWRLSFFMTPKHISIMKLFFIRLIGESLAQINPTNVIAGEALKAILLKKMGISYKNGIVSLTISRFIIFLSAATLIIIGIFSFFDQLKIRGGSFSIIAAIVIGISLLIGLLILLSSGIGIFILPRKILLLLEKHYPESARIEKMSAKLTEVDEELIEFYRTKKINFITAYILSFLHWLTGAVEFYVILILLSYNVPFFSCIAMEVGVMVFKAMGAFVPGQIGVEEYANKLMLEMIHISTPGIWITVSILRRSRQLFWIISGFIAFFITTRKTGEIDNGNPLYNA